MLSLCVYYNLCAIISHGTVHTWWNVYVFVNMFIRSEKLDCVGVTRYYTKYGTIWSSVIEIWLYSILLKPTACNSTTYFGIANCRRQTFKLFHCSFVVQNWMDLCVGKSKIKHWRNQFIYFQQKNIHPNKTEWACMEFVCQSVCLSLLLFVSPSVCLSVCSSVRLFICVKENHE